MTCFFFVVFVFFSFSFCAASWQNKVYIIPWQSGRSATWDVTVVHTLAATYVSQSAVQAGSAATAASARKSAKYSSLSSSHVFCPVAVETLGSLADDTQLFLTEIGRRATLRTAEPREGMFLYQRISSFLVFSAR